MKRVLITGGAGFIGSHTACFLLQKKIAVTVFDNLSTGKLANLDLNVPLLRVVQADVLDYPSLLVEVENCDAILHLAALPSVPLSIQDPLGSHAVNMTGFLHVLQAIRMVGKPIRLVYASSSAIYGDTTKLPCCDESIGHTNVLSPYALQKIQSEQYANLYAKFFAVPSLGLRYFNVYGTKQDPQSVYSGVIARFIKHYQQDLKLSIFGDGHQSRDFIHVTDVARANYLALQGDYCGVLNVATGIPETLSNVISYIEAIGGKKAQLEFMPSRLGDIKSSYAATQKAKQVLNFHFELSLSEGLKQLLYDQED